MIGLWCSAEPPSDYNFLMNAQPAFRVSALLLGIWLALTPAILAVPATGMIYHAGMTEDAARDCEPCPDTGMDREVCAFICLSAPPFAAPHETDDLLAAAGVRHRNKADSSWFGRLFTPDPAPPK